MVQVLDLLPHQILEHEGWIRGDLQVTAADYDYGSDGSAVGPCGRCALGSFIPVDDPEALWNEDTSTTTDRHEFHYVLGVLGYGQEKIDALVQRAREWLGSVHFDTSRMRSDRDTRTPDTLIYLWNDHPDQTAENVIQTLKDVGL